MEIKPHPATRSQKPENTWRFTKAELAALLTCASKDEAREHLCTVVLDAENRTAFATDGHRMLAATAPESMQVQADAGIRLVPRSVVETAIRSARRKTDPIEIRPNCTHAAIVVRDRDGKIASRTEAELCAQQAPPWQQVMPGPREPRTMADRSALADRLARFHENGNLSVAEVCDRVSEAERWAAGSPRIGINAHYLAEVQTLAKVQKAPAALQIHVPSHECDPILLVMDDPDTAYWRCVIMPMRL